MGCPQKSAATRVFLVTTLLAAVTMASHGIAAEQVTMQAKEQVRVKGCKRASAEITAFIRLDEPSDWALTLGATELQGTYATKGKKERKLLLTTSPQGLVALTAHASTSATALCETPTTAESLVLKTFKLMRRKNGRAKLKLLATFENPATGKNGRLRVTGRGQLEPASQTTTTSPTTTVSSSTTTPVTTTTTTTVPNECAEAADDTPCQDDGAACTRDVCMQGVCSHPVAAAGTLCREQASSCDVAEACDGVAADCPADAVVPALTPCNDGNACTLGDYCESGTCEPGSPLACGIGPTSCYQAACDPELGCVPLPDGTPCGFGRSLGPKCSLPTVCVDGACVDDPTVTIECTDDALCSDGDLCNGAESCSNCACQPGQNPHPFGCLDADPCFQVLCDPLSGACTQLVPDVPCPPGQVCVPDGLGLPQCVPIPGTCTTDADCNDGLRCTDDVCLDGACQHLDPGRQGGSCYVAPGETCYQCSSVCSEQAGCLVVCGLHHDACPAPVKEGMFCDEFLCNPADPDADAQGCVRTNMCGDGVDCTGGGAWVPCTECPDPDLYTSRCDDPACRRLCDANDGETACEDCVAESDRYCKFVFYGDTCTALQNGEAVCDNTTQHDVCDQENECTRNVCSPVAGCLYDVEPRLTPCTCEHCGSGVSDVPGICCPFTKSCLSVSGATVCPLE